MVDDRSPSFAAFKPPLGALVVDAKGSEVLCVTGADIRGTETSIIPRVVP